MNQDRTGEINNNRVLMLLNALHVLRPLDRSNLTPRANGLTKPTTYYTDAPIKSHHAKGDD